MRLLMRRPVLILSFANLLHRVDDLDDLEGSLPSLGELLLTAEYPVMPQSGSHYVLKKSSNSDVLGEVCDP